MQKPLTLWGAVFIGLASMLGAGVFVVFGPAANLSGDLMLLAILLAGLVAYLNASSMAQLAKVVTGSGGAYAYARHYISKPAGFLAGSAFLLGKIGSASAIALTFSHYLTPGFESLTAVLAIGLMVGINLLGVNRTALGAKILGGITLSFLLLLIGGSFLAPAAALPISQGDFLGLLTASSMFFFAFAGYARVATLGGEVANPEQNIPRAIALSLGVVFLIYLLLGFSSLGKLGSNLPFTLTPLKDLAAVSLPWLPTEAVAIFASVAALGSLLALLAGMGRTASAMAQDRELPRVMAVRNRRGAPYLAETIIGILAIILVLTGSLESNIGLSSFAVLTYYALANLAAYRQPTSETSRAKSWNILGLLLCLVLAFSVPISGLILGSAVLGLAMVLRFFLIRSSLTL